KKRRQYPDVTDHIFEAGSMNLQLTCHGPVARIAIDRPARRNAFNHEMWLRLPAPSASWPSETR
ncbi:MAG: hypothetical protein LBV50_09870, partial [Novosphingobium sp.]|nr:hypothetical protein [Novosphingobium sp.]